MALAEFLDNEAASLRIALAALVALREAADRGELARAFELPRGATVVMEDVLRELVTTVARAVGVIEGCAEGARRSSG